jgi:hypothetical protein
VLRRAVVLKAAILAYQGDHGRAPAALQELVGSYLRRLPTDPFAEGRHFGYRVSAGEQLVASPRLGGNPPDQQPTQSVRPGQAVIWSVGYDRTDDGGKVPPGGPRARDLVFLVPAPSPP